MKEFTVADVEVDWIERGSTGIVYETQAVFQVEGDDSWTDAQYIERAKEHAESSVESPHVFIEVLSTKIASRWLETPRIPRIYRIVPQIS